MKIKFLSSKDYENKASNCGDCIIITSGAKMIVYDCGCEEHANRVISEMDRLGIKKIIGVLSHNDRDHFDGFMKLKDLGKIDSIYTICALKHVDDILLEINDSRYSRDSVKNKITEIFDNIHELSGVIEDIYDSNNNLLFNDIANGIKLVAPKYDYAIKTIARAIKNSEPNTIDGDSVMNAASVCLKIKDNNSMLLTGDSTFENIKDNLEKVDYIQLPHHGRSAQLDDILEYYDDEDENPVYLISDNTGDSNGGLDKRKLKYKQSKDTRSGDFEISLGNIQTSTFTKTLGIPLNEMFCRFK